MANWENAHLWEHMSVHAYALSTHTRERTYLYMRQCVHLPIEGGAPMGKAFPELYGVKAFPTGAQI